MGGFGLLVCLIFHGFHLLIEKADQCLVFLFSHTLTFLSKLLLFKLFARLKELKFWFEFFGKDLFLISFLTENELHYLELSFVFK